MTGDQKPPPRVDSTLSKGLAIVEHLAGVRGGQRVTDIARDLGMTKSNAFRLLQTLVALGYVRRDADRRYGATLKTWQLGRRTVEALDLKRLAAPILQRLSEKTGETIYLAVREDLQVVYIDKIESRKPIRSWNPVGGVAPLHCVGTGKAILAAEYPALREYAGANLVAYTDRTLTTLTALNRDMKMTAERGYAIDRGEFRDGILSLGAVVTLPDETVVCAIGISVPEVNLHPGDEPAFGRMVAGAARDLSSLLAAT